MQTHQLPTEIARAFDCSSNAAEIHTPASARRAKLEAQINEYLARGNAITEVKTNIVASAKPAKPSRDQIEIPRPNKSQGRHSKNNTDDTFVNIRQAATIVGVAGSTLSQLIKKQIIPLAPVKQTPTEKLLLKTDVLAYKQQRDAQKESQS